MALRGQPNSESITIVSVGQAPSESLSVVITPPVESPFTKRIAKVRLDWIDGAGNAADVDGFSFLDLVGTTGGKLFNFQQLSDSSYTVDVRLERNIQAYTLTVRRNAAALKTNATVLGPVQDTSATFLVKNETPIVKISVDGPRPVTARPIRIDFNWVYSDKAVAHVENFDITDITTDVGRLHAFATGLYGQQWTVYLEILPTETNSEVTITVKANSAQVLNSTPAVLGPEEDTDFTFSISAPPALATITGADSYCVFEKEIVSNDLLNDVLAHLGSNAGGGFTGVLESVSIGDYVYLVVQIRKFRQSVDDDGDLVIPAKPANSLSNAQAGAALLRCNTDTCVFDVLKTYSDVTLAARSLTVDGNTLYFMEGSHYLYTEGLIFSEQQWRENVGKVYKIAHPSTAIQALGTNWRSASTTDNPDTETTDYFYGIHGGTVSPLLVTDNILYLLTGYGDFEGVADPLGTQPAKRIGNWNLIQYHTKINQRISEVRTNGRTPYNMLKDIAVTTNSVLGFENDTFFMHPRDPQKAISDNGSGITATQQSITAKDLNWGTFPTAGWLLINDELIQHSGANSGQTFTSVVRGAESTTPAAHTGNFDIRFVDHILALTADTLEMPIKSVQIQNDTRQLYNQIRLRYGTDDAAYREDATSISENGARLLDIDVPLDKHQRTWAEWLAESYLARFKAVQQLLNLTLKPTYYMTIGDVVYVKIPERVHLDGTVCQVLEVRHSFRKPPRTFITLVTL